jgi:hypothetical protein
MDDFSRARKVYFSKMNIKLVPEAGRSRTVTGFQPEECPAGAKARLLLQPFRHD